ncbi:hypothetical protein K505DRAFT_305361 [Melanomma pulvis-pyrius CBS 109.77]|uniref:DUF7703 domain-containing protein n=1 Tax=Melanomma pulvis-pyrius CBS 109.77 TaxID=1314802 RepID=A0A6A6XBT0_9PLEO|nr:hypothetical protein K505DRAFT_305361 [Melanomma pulvis-pyrius CBS 109.77]
MFIPAATSANCSLTGGNGISGGNFDVYGADRTIPRSMTAFTAIAWYNAAEILVLIFFVFKKYSGLYFWSLVGATLGVVPYATGAWLKQNNVSHNNHVTEALLTLGWVIMVPGQSLVLYSRLHLISSNERLLRAILYTILTTAVVLCVPTATLNLRQYTKHPEAYTRGYVVMEKIQMSIFTAQEVFISLFYCWEVRRVLQLIAPSAAPASASHPASFAFAPSYHHKAGGRQTRKAMWQLVAMNVLLLVLDAVLLAVEFQNLYMIQTTFKSLVYSVKLKVEFAVLSQIKGVMKTRSAQSSLTLAIPRGEDEEGKGVATVGVGGDCEAQLQGNLPVEWRIEVGDEVVAAPRFMGQGVGMGMEREEGSPTYSLSSVERMYPGKLVS